MKVLHVDFTGPFSEDMGYQMNWLTRQNVNDGHSVFIAATDEYFKNGQVISLKLRNKESQVNSDGVLITRFPYSSLINSYVSSKIRRVKDFLKYIEGIAPDVILFHGCTGYELLTAAKYKKAHPQVKLYADSHEDFSNSARNFLSKNILHRLFYKPIALRALPWIDRVFYITEETKHFMQFFYKIPEDKLEFYPLGGTVFPPEKRASLRNVKRSELGVGDDDILLCHSGKLDALKRTKNLLAALSRVSSERLKLIIIGNIPNEMKPILEPMIAADKRVTFLGWKSGDELVEYLCACDMYVQPGAQSATMQNALCCGAPVMLYPRLSHIALRENYGMRGNAYFVESAVDIEKAFREILENPETLRSMSRSSLRFAEEKLDYRRLAARLYE